jgi:hypothetical protein
MMSKRRLIWVGVLTATAVMTIGATALAEGGKGNKEGCAKKAEARFEKSDKNSDGFLTAAEVGDKKWNRIKVADANNDAKVSLAEMKQAKADGKLKHKGKKDKKKKGTTA